MVLLELGVGRAGRGRLLGLQAGGADREPGEFPLLSLQRGGGPVDVQVRVALDGRCGRGTAGLPAPALTRFSAALTAADTVPSRSPGGSAFKFDGVVVGSVAVVAAVVAAAAVVVVVDLVGGVVEDAAE